MNWLSWIWLPIFPQLFIIKNGKHIRWKKKTIYSEHSHTIYIQLWTLERTCFLSVHLFVPLPILQSIFFFSLYFELSCMHSYTFSWLLTSSLNFVHFNNFFVYVQAHLPARKENRSSWAKNYDLEIRRDLSLDSSNTRSYRAVNGRWRCCPSGGISPPYSLLLNLLQDCSLDFFEPHSSPLLAWLLSFTSMACWGTKIIPP